MPFWHLQFKEICMFCLRYHYSIFYDGNKPHNEICNYKVSFFFFVTAFLYKRIHKYIYDYCVQLKEESN